MSAHELPFDANLQRGRMLRAQNRYADAEQFLQAAIAQDPSRAEPYYELAFCYCDWRGHSKKALEMIDRAIALNPARPVYFGLRAWILVNLKKYKEALRTAGQGLEMDPFCLLALNAQTRAYIALSQWVEAETNARRALAHSPDSAYAANLLAIALRQLGRNAESQAVTAGLLARTPDNAMAHSNAGWSALHAGDHHLANLHFLESLRLDPNFDHARRGLLHSFNSRVWIYRLYFQFVSWLGAHTRGMRYAVLIGIYIIYRVIGSTLIYDFGDNGIHWAFVVCAFYFVIFGFGRSFGNLFLLLDPFARHALTAKEKGWSALAGAIYLLILIYESAAQAWLQLAVLLVIPGCFLWGVLYPRVRDAFVREDPLNEASTEQT